MLLIGPKRTRRIADGLAAAGFPAENIRTFATLREANDHLTVIAAPGDVILYENDLPDQYTEAQRGANERNTAGILYGSRSCGARGVGDQRAAAVQHVDRERYDVILVYISQQGEWFIGEPLSDIDTYRPFFQNDAKGLVRVLPDMTARSGALIAFERQGLYRGSRVDIAARLDCVIPVMHGLHGEDGTLQGLLEMMDIPYASTGVAGSSIGMDKIMMKAFFRGMGFPCCGCAVMRSDWTADREAVMDRVEEALSYLCM